MGVLEETLFVMCDACNPRGEVLTKSKVTSRSELMKDLKKKPQVVVACTYCGSRMTFDSAKVPTGGYSLEAELASPDGSGAAWVGPYRPFPSIKKRLEPPPPPPPIEEPPDELHEVRSQAERMRNLVRLEQEMRDEFKGDKAFLEQLDRIFGKKKREILGHPPD